MQTAATNKPPKKLDRASWRKTPYAGSTAKNTENNIENLCRKYKVDKHSIQKDVGENGRPAYGVRFEVDRLWYVIVFEVMHAEASQDELMLQAKRFCYHAMKTAMEQAVFFEQTGQPKAKAFFTYLETPAGKTLFDVAAPILAKLQTDGMPQLGYQPT